MRVWGRVYVKQGQEVLIMVEVYCGACGDYLGVEDTAERWIPEVVICRDCAACPLCGGAGEVLGTLGRRIALRCRQCGGEWGLAQECDSVAEGEGVEGVAEVA